VVEWVTEIPFEAAMTFLSPIAADVYFNAFDRKRQIELAERLWPPTVVGPIRDFLDEDPNYVVFDELSGIGWKWSGGSSKISRCTASGMNFSGGIRQHLAISKDERKAISQPSGENPLVGVSGGSRCEWTPVIPVASQTTSSQGLRHSWSRTTSHSCSAMILERRWV
jgi:hypothetical protein